MRTRGRLCSALFSLFLLCALGADSFAQDPTPNDPKPNPGTNDAATEEPESEFKRFSITGDANGQSGSATTGSGGVGLNVEARHFSLYFLGQVGSAPTITGSKPEDFSKAILVPGSGAGTATFDLRIFPVPGKSQDGFKFLSGLNFRLRGNGTIGKWTLADNPSTPATGADGSPVPPDPITSSDIYTLTYSAALSYNLDITSLANMEDRDKYNIAISADLAVSGRLVAGDVDFARTALGVQKLNYFGGELTVCAYLNALRVFATVPFLSADGLKGVDGVSFLIGAGVRGDVYQTAPKAPAPKPATDKDRRVTPLVQAQPL